MTINHITSYAYQQARKHRLTQAATNNEPCWICGHPIDYTLPYKNPTTGAINRWSPTTDHITPRHHGGHPTDPNNLAPAHHTCNSSRQARQAHITTTNWSRDWTQP